MTTDKPQPEFPEEDPGAGPAEGVALCLSGGGYRAMVFHLGALIRLNEVGLLNRLARISSVSGGSITAGVLGLLWKHLTFGPGGVASNFEIVVDKVRSLAEVTVDLGAVGWGILLPGSISDRVAAAYDRVLFDGAKLADLPDDANGEGPRFILNATNVQTSALWRFSREYMGDYRVGLVKDPDVSLAAAVAASSAFPPILSPATLMIRQPVVATRGADLHRPPYTERAVLSDGGVYDNMGLEPVIKRYRTLLVGDAGQKIVPEPSPHEDWARHALRVLDLIDNQVRSLRRRHLIESYQRAERGEAPEHGARSGAYWGIRTRFADYKLDVDSLGCANRDPASLAEIPTRLEQMPPDLQEQLINWGYAVCDAALRARFDPELAASLGVTLVPPVGFPYPGGY